MIWSSGDDGTGGRAGVELAEVDVRLDVGVGKPRAGVVGFWGVCGMKEKLISGQESRFFGVTIRRPGNASASAATGVGGYMTDSVELDELLDAEETVR